MNRRLLRGNRLSVSLAICGLILLSAGCQKQKSVAVMTPQMLCEQWLSLKNAGDPSADQLLVAIPDVPADAI